MAAKDKLPLHKPKWHATKFGCLLPGYWFKASKSNQTWWIKRDDTTAASVNGQLTSPWRFDDLVWVDISTNLAKNRFLDARDADCPA